jgi:drug/metabolite transporter (DMT)-like permease
MGDFLLAFLAVGLNAAAQLFLRSAMGRLGSDALSLGDLGPMLPRLLVSPPLLGGLGCYGVSLLLWLVVLSRLPVSVAYPLQSLGYVLVALAARSLLGETLSVHKVAALTLIVLGVALLAREGP